MITILDLGPVQDLPEVRVLAAENPVQPFWYIPDSDENETDTMVQAVKAYQAAYPHTPAPHLVVFRASRTAFGGSVTQYRSWAAIQHFDEVKLSWHGWDNDGNAQGPAQSGPSWIRL